MMKNIKARLSIITKSLLAGELTRNQRSGVPAITLEQVAEAKSFFPMEKFFIFGHARAGTTLLTRLIRLHPDVHCNYQAHFFTRAPLLQSLVDTRDMEAWFTRRSNRWNRGGDLSPVVLRAASDFILERDARREGKNIVGDKSPNSLLNGESVRLMHKVYPDARLIFIIRDGRDTAVSHRFQTFIDASQHLSGDDLRIRENIKRDPKQYMEGKNSIFTEKGLRSAAEGWVKNVEETDELGREFYKDHYFSLRFEDLLDNPHEAMKSVWDFLNVDLSLDGLGNAIISEFQNNPDANWQEEKDGAFVIPQQKGIHGSWKRIFTDNDRALFHRIAGETLVNWGYTVDD